MFQKEEEKTSASQVLMEVANTLPLFHDQNGEAYAFVNGECVALRSQMLKTWLTYMSRKSIVVTANPHSVDFMKPISIISIIQITIILKW